MVPQVSILFICERAEQVTGSGCCGKLEGDNVNLGGRDLFEHTHQQRQAFGRLHRTIRHLFADELAAGRIEITTVDPRNQLYLVGRLIKDVYRYRPGWRAGLRTLLQLFPIPAVIVNGRVVTRRSQVCDPDTLCHQVQQLLGASASQPTSPSSASNG